MGTTKVKITLTYIKEWPDVDGKLTKHDAKEMALDDFYDDMRHGSLGVEPKVEVTRKCNAK